MLPTQSATMAGDEHPEQHISCDEHVTVDALMPHSDLVEARKLYDQAISSLPDKLCASEVLERIE